MKRNPLLTIFLIGLVVLIMFALTPSRWKANLISPMGQKTNNIAASPSPTPIPTPNVPKSFTFDHSTNLKAELDKVDPQISDNDFE